MKNLTWERVAVALLAGVLSLSCFIGKGYADRVDKLEVEANQRDTDQAVTNALLLDIRDRVKRIEARLEK